MLAILRQMAISPIQRAETATVMALMAIARLQSLSLQMAASLAQVQIEIL